MIREWSRCLSRLWLCGCQMVWMNVVGRSVGMCNWLSVLWRLQGLHVVRWCAWMVIRVVTNPLLYRQSLEVSIRGWQCSQSVYRKYYQNCQIVKLSGFPNVLLLDCQGYHIPKGTKYIDSPKVRISNWRGISCRALWYFVDHFYLLLLWRPSRINAYWTMWKLVLDQRDELYNLAAG
jgi:hypothetical protein